jgi:hypothetical protein
VEEGNAVGHAKVLPVERYYQCPSCTNEWTYNVERNLYARGVPAHTQKQ